MVFKKWVALSLIFVGLMSVDAFAEINAFINSYEGNIVECEYMVNDEAVTATAVCVGYDDGGELIEVKHSPLIAVANSDVIKHFEFEKQVDEVRTFVLESLDSLRPCCNVAVMKAGDEGSKVKWDFSADEFYQLGDLTEKTTVNGMSLNYEAKAMTFRKGSIGGKGLNLYGGGNVKSCSVSFKVNGPCIVRIYSSSTTDVSRTMKITNANSKVLESYSVGGEVDVHDFSYNGNGEEIFVFSNSSGVYLYSIEVFYSPEQVKKYSNIYVDDFESLRLAIARSDMADGGNVYVAADKILCKEAIYLSGENSNTIIQGVKGFDCVLDYSEYFKDERNSSNGVGNHGIRITGSGYTVKNLIIENVPGNGISIRTESAKNNLIDSVVIRYSSHGISINNGASNNVIKNCYAYRNCDVYTCGGNADGFSASISAGADNTYIGCHSWENSDDGYDNFANYETVSYYNCTAWNNGDYNVAIGRYDYNNHKPLDKNLPFVKIMLENDPDFESNYNNRKFKLSNEPFVAARINEVDSVVTPASVLANWAGNPNGFKLGSGDSKHGPKVESDTLRVLEGCIAFKHKGKGIDRNNSSVTISLEDTLSFDNNRNYLLDDTIIIKFENQLGFGGAKTDLLDGNSENKVITPTAAEIVEYRQKVNQKAEELMSLVSQNIIPESFSFEIFE